MNTASHVKSLLNQDKTGYSDEVAQLNQALKTTRDKLETALRTNMSTLNNPILSNEELDNRLKSIMTILSAPISALPEIVAENVDDLRKRLHDVTTLYDQMQPSFTARLNVLGFSTSTREKVKNLLNTVVIRETIDPCINDYLKAQSRLLAEHIAYHHALEQAAWLVQSQKDHPSASVDILLLARHEVCATLNKGMGLIEDAALDALTLGANQSLFALTLVQWVKEKTLLYLKQTQHLHEVKLIVSPVARAYQTALHGSFSSASVTEVVIDPYYAEQQLNTPFTASRRASRLASDVAKDFQKEGYTASFKGEFLPGNERDSITFLRRLAMAFNRTISHQFKQTGMQAIIGHSTMNLHLLQYLRYYTACNNIPAQPPLLGFGGYYYLLLIHKEGAIQAVEYKGRFDRYGQRQKPIPAPIKATSHRDHIKRLDDEDIPQAATPELKAVLLFHRCFLEDDADAMSRVLNSSELVDIMLDHLCLLDNTSVKKQFALLKQLTEIHLKRVEKRMEEEGSSYSFSNLISSLKNTASGKHPRPQYLILKELLAIEQRIEKNTKHEDPLPALEELIQKSEKTCYEGKVTNLCRAVRDLEVSKILNLKTPQIMTASQDGSPTVSRL